MTWWTSWKEGIRFVQFAIADLCLKNVEKVAKVANAELCLLHRCQGFHLHFVATTSHPCFHTSGLGVGLGIESCDRGL